MIPLCLFGTQGVTYLIPKYKHTLLYYEPYNIYLYNTQPSILKWGFISTYVKL